MTIRLTILSLLASTLWTACAEVKIPVANSGFETDDLICAPSSECFQFGVTGWLAGPQSGVFKPSASQFPGGVPGGQNVGFIGGSNATGSLSQITSSLVRANATYTLTLNVGRRADYPNGAYVASLVAGNEILASDSSASPGPGEFLLEVLVYKSGPNPPQLGLPLVIFLKSVGSGQIDVDNVSLAVE